MFFPDYEKFAGITQSALLTFSVGYFVRLKFFWKVSNKQVLRKPQELRKDIRKELQPTTIMTLAPTLSITAHTLLLSGSKPYMRM